MDNLPTVAFEAHHPERNHHRRHGVTLGRDQLDNWTAEIRCDRCGRGSQGKRSAEMNALVRDRLRRLLSAPKRIGCSYRLDAFNTAMGLTPQSGCRER